MSEIKIFIADGSLSNVSSGRNYYTEWEHVLDSKTDVKNLIKAGVNENDSVRRKILDIN